MINDQKTVVVVLLIAIVSFFCSMTLVTESPAQIFLIWVENVLNQAVLERLKANSVIIIIICY